MSRVTVVKLRPLTRLEKNLLAQKVADKKLPARLHQRYRIIAELTAGRGAYQVAERVGCHPDTVYLWLHRFNAEGFAPFEAPPNPQGHASSLSREQVVRLIETATSRPADLGLPFTQWSTAKLRNYCVAHGWLPPIGDEWCRRLLRREGVTPQRTKTWLASPDPNFERKKSALCGSTAGPPKEAS